MVDLASNMKVAMLFLAAVISGSAAEPKQLFNGKDLSGWTMVGPGRFVVEDGLLKTEGGMGLLYFNGQRFGNQTIRVTFKTASPRANSGVFVRLPEAPRDPWYGVHNGYEVQIDSAGDEWHSTGAIYSLSKIEKRTQKPQGEWNVMEIELDGDTTRISLNGETVNQFSGSQPVPDRKQWFEPIRGPRPEMGYIGLQNHDAQSVVYFKEVAVLPLPGKSPLTQGERDRQLSYMHSTRKQIVDAATGLSDEQMNYKPGADRWSVAEVLEHIVLSESTLFALAESGLRRSAPAPEQKVKDEDFIKMLTDRSRKAEAPSSLRPTGQWKGAGLVEEFKRRRDKNIDWIRETQAGLRSHYVKLQAGTVDVYQCLLLIAAHSERHLAQMLEAKASPGFPKGLASQ